MANKLITFLLIILVLVSGALGYYSYTLNQQITSLSRQLIDLQQEQTRQITVLNEGFTAFQGETATRLNALSLEINAARNKITALEDELGNTLTSIENVQAEVSRIQDDINDMETDLSAISGLSVSVINANEVYEKVNAATLLVSDGGGSTHGSGFLFDSNAHVATAYHVIENLSKIYVTFPDGSVSLVTATASSPESDVAILTITDKPGFSPPLLANSSKVLVGEPVVAIGNPFDLPETVTSGVISQTGRFTEITNGSQSKWVANLLQFDAAANPGNSGGPLFNARGEVVGMVIARVNPDVGDGINYAVSSNKLKRVADALIAEGKFDYPWLGVNIHDLTPQIVQDMGLPDIYGVQVFGITPESPADTAGIIDDDIIVGMDSFIIRHSADLTSYLGEHKSSGEEAIFDIIRGENRLKVTLTIGTRPS
ncbi:trypsin-like peptidase domain-containing protein [Chloroflexota bacterium]